MTKILRLDRIENFSDRVTRWRESTSLSVIQCAKLCGITRGYWYRIEQDPELTIKNEVYQKILKLMELH